MTVQKMKETMEKDEEENRQRQAFKKNESTIIWPNSYDRVNRLLCQNKIN